MIERIEYLNGLRFIKKLDLSANQIRVIHGLKGLNSLEYLNLSGNKIVSLLNLRQVLDMLLKLSLKVIAVGSEKLIFQGIIYQI